MSTLSILVSLLFFIGAYVMYVKAGRRLDAVADHYRRAADALAQAGDALHEARSLNDKAAEWLKVSDR